MKISESTKTNIHIMMEVKAVPETSCILNAVLTVGSVEHGNCETVTYSKGE
jgi:hypothetical protein